MSATSAAVNPTVNTAAPSASAPGRPASAPSDEDRFDRHLDAARQHHGEAHDQPAQDDTAHAPAPAKAATPTKAEHPATSTEPGPDATTDAAALAAAMLALIGQAAAPAKPLALAAGVAHAAKTITGAHASPATTGALALLGANAAATPGGKPAITLDTTAMAPMLAKPAEQKDMPLDATQLANLSTAPMATSAGAPVAPAHALEIASPAGTPAFAQELGQHVVWLGLQDIKQARIRLHPEDLGTLDVKVSMNHDRVDVSFAVQHPAAVHVVQQTLPQLDALLAHHGLSLGQTDVGQRQQQGGASRGTEGSDGIGGIDSAEPMALASTPVSALGLLDTFA